MARFDDVEVFLRVVERGSFNGAAEQLGIPATSVSRRVRALEEKLGVQLLHRTTRRVWTSDAGQAYYERCVAAVEALDEADAAVRALKQEPEGHLKVLMTYAPALLVLEPELATFRKLHPKVKLHLTLDNHALDLVEHGFDVAVRTGPVRDSSYHVRRLASLPLKLLAAPGYLDRMGRPSHPSELSGHDLIAVRQAPGALHWPLEGPDSTCDVKVDPVLDTNDPILALRQTISGAGILLMSGCLARRRILAGELEVVLPDWRLRHPMETVALFPARATRDLKVRVFVDFLVQVFARWQEPADAPAP